LFAEQNTLKFAVPGGLIGNQLSKSFMLTVSRCWIES
jgi:hypothetical protein